MVIKRLRLNHKGDGKALESSSDFANGNNSNITFARCKNNWLVTVVSTVYDQSPIKEKCISRKSMVE